MTLSGMRSFSFAAAFAALIATGLPAAAQDMGSSDPATKALWRSDAAAYAEAERRILAMPDEGAGQDLHLYDLRALDRIPPAVSRLSRLATIWLGSTVVRDLRPLAGMPRLRLVNVSRTQVGDLTPLLSLPALKEVILSGAPAAKDERGLDLLEARGVKLDVREESGGGFFGFGED